jgi:hypothetical protein
VVQSSAVDLSNIKINGQPLTDQQKFSFEHSPMFQYGGSSMTLYLKGDRARIESPAFTIISDNVAKTTTNLDTTNKTYWVTPLSDAAAAQLLKRYQINVQDLGTTQQILGYDCHGYDVTITEPHMTMDIKLWTAQGLYHLPQGSAVGNPWLDAYKEKVSGFPLKTVVTMSNPIFGLATTTTEVQSISKAPLPDSLFAPPADYKQVAPPSLPPSFKSPLSAQ